LILDKLPQKVSSPWDRRWYRPLTPFERLISTILSQNTSREATIKGFENLRKRFTVVPEVLAEAEVEEIKECIKPSGLYNTKAPRIREVSRIIVEEYGGDLNSLSRLSTDMARERLLKIPGVGFKTADIILSLVMGRGSFAVDTHIGRIARNRAHLALIEFGREICRARGPRCAMCPVYGECEWEGKSESKGVA
jgi:endonuclease-3